MAINAADGNTGDTTDIAALPEIQNEPVVAPEGEDTQTLSAPPSTEPGASPVEPPAPPPQPAPPTELQLALGDTPRPAADGEPAPPNSTTSDAPATPATANPSNPSVETNPESQTANPPADAQASVPTPVNQSSPEQRSGTNDSAPASAETTASASVAPPTQMSQAQQDFLNRGQDAAQNGNTAASIVFGMAAQGNPLTKTVADVATVLNAGSNPAAAVQALGALTKTDPQVTQFAVAATRVATGEIPVETTDQQLAVASGLSSIALGKNSVVPTGINLARDVIAGKDTAGSIQAVGNAAGIDPKTTEVAIGVGKLLLGETGDKSLAGKVEAAGKVAATAFGDNSVVPTGLDLASKVIAGKDTADSIQAVGNAAGIDPKTTEVAIGVGKLLLGQTGDKSLAGKVEAAGKVAATAFGDNSVVPTGLDLASKVIAGKDTAGSIQAVGNAAGIDPKTTEVAIGVGKLLLGQTDDKSLAGKVEAAGKVAATAFGDNSVVPTGLDLAGKVIAGKDTSDSIKNLGNAVGIDPKITNTVVDIGRAVLGTDPVTDAKSAIALGKTLAKDLGGQVGDQLGKGMDIAGAVNNTLGANLNSAKGQQTALNAAGSIVTALGGDPKIAQGAALASNVIGAIGTNVSAASAAGIGVAAANLLGIKGPVVDVVGTAVGLITNPIGTIASFALGGLSDLLAWKPNENKLADVNKPLLGADGKITIVQQGERLDGKTGLGMSIFELNQNKVALPGTDRTTPIDPKAYLTKDVMRQGEFITSEGGAYRAGLTANGLETQKKVGADWVPTYRAGVAAPEGSVFYIDPADGKGKIAFASQNAETGKTDYTPIWQTDGGIGTVANGRQAVLHIPKSGELEFATQKTDGTDTQWGQLRLPGFYDKGTLGMGGYYRKSDTGQLIAAPGTPVFQTKGEYGNFNNPNQAEKIVPIAGSPGLFDVTFKDDRGADKAIVSQQRNAADVAQNASLSFLEVSDIKDLATAQNFNKIRVAEISEINGALTSGQLQLVTGIKSSAPASDDKYGIKSASDGKNYVLYADKNDPTKTVRVETSKVLENQARLERDLKKLMMR
jgi:hypothetical protein